MHNYAPYIYAKGNLLEQPNTYFYSQYSGMDFLVAWNESRRSALAVLPEPVEMPAGFVTEYKTDKIDTMALLDSLMNYIEQSSNASLDGELLYWSGKLVKKFEVSKRVYRYYQLELPHRPVIDSGYDGLALYLRFAELMARLYKKTSLVQYLNVLLKVMDTIISVHKDLPDVLAARLHNLILIEIDIVSNLTEQKGINI